MRPLELNAPDVAIACPKVPRSTSEFVYSPTQKSTSPKLGGLLNDDLN